MNVDALNSRAQPEDDGNVSAAINARIDKYSTEWSTLVNDTATTWAAAGSVVAPDTVLSLRDLVGGPASAAAELRRSALHSWEARESLWHSYMLRSGLTFDSYYGNHILNQNGNYLFISGEQAGKSAILLCASKTSSSLTEFPHLGMACKIAAARDPLAYAMTLSLTGPGTSDFVVEILNYTLMSKLTQPVGQQPVGAIPWGRQAYGVDSSGSFHASDLELALLFTLGFHVLSTHNISVLSAPVPWNGSWTTVGDAAWASFLRLRDDIGVGPHGLIHLRLSDHNDGLLGNLGVKGDNATTAVDLGESVMNSAYGAYVLPFFVGALQLQGMYPDRAAAVEAFQAGLLAAVAAQWVSPSAPKARYGWFRRVSSAQKNSVGEVIRTSMVSHRPFPMYRVVKHSSRWCCTGVMWTETQAWALLSRRCRRYKRYTALAGLARRSGATFPRQLVPSTRGLS